MLLMWLCAKTQEFVGDDMWSIGRNGAALQNHQSSDITCARVADTTMLELSLSLKPQTLRAEQRC